MIERHWHYGRRLCEGIAAYARETGDLALDFIGWDAANDTKAIRQFDGLIARVWSDGISDRLSAAERPVVDVYSGKPGDDFVLVDQNPRLIGQLAARKKLTRFGEDGACLALTPGAELLTDFFHEFLLFGAKVIHIDTQCGRQRVVSFLVSGVGCTAFIGCNAPSADAYLLKLRGIHFDILTDVNHEVREHADVPVLSLYGHDRHSGVLYLIRQLPCNRFTGSGDHLACLFINYIFGEDMTSLDSGW